MLPQTTARFSHLYMIYQQILQNIERNMDITITWTTALQNSKELRNMVSSGMLFTSSTVRQCQWSAWMSSLRGSREYRAPRPPAKTCKAKKNHGKMLVK